MRRRVDSWKLAAACRGEPVHVFFDDAYLEVAQSFCDRCSVRAECYRAARRNDEFGVWAGRMWRRLDEDGGVAA